jgi:DNA phosphorothioation-dependent restriction protein DptG
MKPTKIEFQYDKAKLEAINLYLEDKGSNISDKLNCFMEDLYKTHVPQSVREFIEKKDAEAQQNASASRFSSCKKPESRSNEEAFA